MVRYNSALDNPLSHSRYDELTNICTIYRDRLDSQGQLSSQEPSPCMRFSDTMTLKNTNGAYMYSPIHFVLIKQFKSCYTHYI